MHKNTKWIVLTGGVLSGLGKGVATASIGKLLSPDYRIVPIKCDGYLNVDPGTMNPIEHGEVFVLDDGGEVDMDFGHYERFLGIHCKSDWNLTMGKVFHRIRRRERRGDYLGQTVQYIPHVTNLIKAWWKEIAKKEKADIVLIEIGGTIGDIENELFVESARQLRNDVGGNNILYAHLTYVPIPTGINEQKSKPTQQSINLLREKGIAPDIIIGRCAEILDEKIKRKIATFCNVREEDVITGLDVSNIYEIPLVFQEEGVPEIINEKLNMAIRPKMRKWKSLVHNMKSPKKTVRIAICGKYTELEDSYASIVESLNHASAHLSCRIETAFIETSAIKNVGTFLRKFDGVIIPGGFGRRGAEGKIKIVQYCREKSKPLLGICYGFQLMVVEFARNVCQLKDANSTEIKKTTKHPVIDILPEQKGVLEKGGTMRLGSYFAALQKESKVYQLYGKQKITERHRHRYEVNPEYHNLLSSYGLQFSGVSPDGRLIELIELKNHPYFVGCQGHPELKSSLLSPAPLFYGFVEEALNHG